MTDYQRIILAGPTIDGPPGLPAEHIGLSDETLADFAAACDPCPEHLVGIGYWPIQPAAAAPIYKVAVSRAPAFVDNILTWVEVLEDGPRPTGDEINAERDRRIEAGATFVVTGYGPVPLQGRLKDQINLQARLIAAQGAKALGVTDPILVLRDAADANHMLTPDQMIELVTMGVAWIEATMQVSWDMKDGAAPFEAGPPYDYTDDGYWP